MTLIGGYLAILANDGIETHQNNIGFITSSNQTISLGGTTPISPQYTLGWSVVFAYVFCKTTSGGQNRYVYVYIYIYTYLCICSTHTHIYIYIYIYIHNIDVRKFQRSMSCGADPSKVLGCCRPSPRCQSIPNRCPSMRLCPLKEHPWETGTVPQISSG